jgi:cellulose synthase/poly-beta-1,6-N-acetylglucosamine synthase-like glycosyltransferase
MMQAVLTAVFWVAATLLVYHHMVFPALMWALAHVRPRPTRADRQHQPSVSVVIAAFNEEKTIASKIRNTLALDYPRALLEIVVAADGSSDGTAAIAHEFKSSGVRLLHRPERQGKSAALDRAVPQCAGDIVLFSDANTHYEPDALRLLVQHFADPEVGGVCGRKIVVDDSTRAATQGETAYWGFESTLKEWESRCGSIVTADGEMFAMRRSLFPGLDRSIVHDDMYLTLSLVERGYRVVYEPRATSAECASKNLVDEFHLKVRYASAGYQILSHFRGLFAPVPGAFGLQFLSHKVLRWTAPLLLLAIFGSTAFLAGSLYRLLFVGQVIFYAVAITGWVLRRRTTGRLFYFPLYFSVMNAAALYGFVRYMAMGQSPLWRKAER